MKPKRSGPEPLRGQFRVSNDVLYQKTTPQSKDFDKVIGKNSPKGDATTIDFTDLRGFDKDKKVHSGLKGTARMRLDRVGEWSGLFTDAEGRNWDFKCSRVQE
jgi:hypothetical protein